MDRTLRIFFTSDTHGYLYPTNYADSADRPMGVMKLANAFSRDGDTLIIDGGDTIQGSPLTNLYHRLPEGERAACLSDTQYGAHPIAAMMNLAGYQFVTLGNHDFNNGLDALGDYLASLDALCLCCNIRDREGRLPIAPYAIHRLDNGLRVGLVGACTHYVSRWENPKTTAQLIIEEPVPAAARALDALRGQCDVTVLIYHGGFECDLETGRPLTDSTENEACRLCRELDFDVVLTGHQHMRVDGVSIGGSFAVQPGYRAPHACAVTVRVDEAGRKAVSGEIVPPAAAPLPGAEALLAPLERRVQAWLDTPAGRLDIPLTSGDPLSLAVNGCVLANFINTVQRDVSGAQVSSCALPNEFKGIPQDVTVRDVVATYIYANTLVVLELDRAGLRRYIERCADYFDHDAEGRLCISDEFLCPKVSHYNYDYFSGIDYVIDTRRPRGDRVTSIRLDGRELDEGETVTVCINSYRYCGTGGYGFLPGQKVVAEIQTDVADAIIDYIVTHPEIHVDTHRYCTVIG